MKSGSSSDEPEAVSYCMKRTKSSKRRSAMLQLQDRKRASSSSPGNATINTEAPQPIKDVCQTVGCDAATNEACHIKTLRVTLASSSQQVAANDHLEATQPQDDHDHDNNHDATRFTPVCKKQARRNTSGGSSSSSWGSGSRLGSKWWRTRGGKLNGSSSSSSWRAILLTLTFICVALIDWRPTSVEPSLMKFIPSSQPQPVPLMADSWSNQLLTLVQGSVWGLFGAGNRRSLTLLASAQYRPEWPSSMVQQEIFLLNLEDGYFGCQVNESQDFLQLFELSRLCDGQPQCYLGTDEMSSPLKCNSRERCSASVSTSAAGTSHGSPTTALANRPEAGATQCVHGVCLDGLCYCNDGYGGKSCDVPDENECKFRPCDVFAHCTNTMGSYYCSCFPGYDGDGMHCQDINECEIPSLAALCQDNSECCNLPGHFVCKCKPGYQQAGQSQSLLSGGPSGNTSVTCTDIDECQDERACGRGATCDNLPGSFRCSCPAGFTGDPSVECFDMDECRNNPCGPDAQCTNIPGGYRCSCAPGFERNPSFPATLFGTIQSSALSVQQQIEISQANLTMPACLDVNECLKSTASGSSVCGSGAQCINTPGGHFCQCPPNYTGNPKVACLDIDECASGPVNVCGSNAICKNTPGGYQCDCKSGYSGNAYSPDGCQDEDECLKKGACGENAQCFNTPGGHECTCPGGFTGNPRQKCTDIDECLTPGTCGPGAQCINVAGSFRCSCPDKYMARSSPELGCERAAVDIGCVGEEDCTANAVCVNASCQCKLGYQAKGIECVDIDECSLGQPLTKAPQTKLGLALQSQFNSSQASDLLCGPEATCHNLEGSYRCDCKPGYEKLEPQSSRAKCRDINECDKLSPCGQNSQCFNTDGAFNCACTDGYIAVDADPANGCKSPCDGVNCGQHATCKPQGEEAACVCKPGFTFDPNNIKLGCVDINECDTNYGPSGLCGLRALCTNIPGSYRCHCPTGFTGDAERYCEDVNECDRRFGVFGQCGELAVCNNTLGSFTCACASGYTGDPRVKCSDVDECSTKFGPNGKCGRGATCINAPGKFTCRCPAGFTGDPFERCKPEPPVCASNSDCPTNQVCQFGRCNCPYALAEDDLSGECRNPCDKTECGAHATCLLDTENAPLCVCDAGYMAPGDGRSGCVDVNECIQGGASLSGVTPISTLSANGLRGSIAQGGPNNGSAHPCGRNALCRNQPGSFDCVCPPGYSGDAYTACQPEVSRQEMTATTTTTTTITTTGKTTGENFVQEPRTSACPEPCSSGYYCSDGRCVKQDTCRDNNDCRSSMSCERVPGSQGYQCVNPCDFLSPCGPEAKCAPVNHRPICVCNTSAGYSGNPYDLTVGCRLMATTTSSTQQPSLMTTTSMQSTINLNGKQPDEQDAVQRTSNSNNNNNQHQHTDAVIHSRVPSELNGQLKLNNSQLTAEQQVPSKGLPLISGGQGSTAPVVQQTSGSTSSPSISQRQQQQSTQRPQTIVTSMNNNNNKKKPLELISASQTGGSNQRQDLFEGNQQLEEPADALLTNKSSPTPAQAIHHPHLTCTTDQHCPGNLFCLPADSSQILRPNQKLCGCPVNYRREGDYCYMHRVNCTSTALCKAREECISTGATYSSICICPRGYKLTQTGVACIDRNECDEGTPCAVGATCQNKIGSYECVCPPGTLGDPYTRTCEPLINNMSNLNKQQEECSSNSDCANDRECDKNLRLCVSPCHVCGPRAICTASNHAAICLCPPRFTGSAIDQVYGCQEPPQRTSIVTPTPAAPTTTTSSPEASTLSTGDTKQQQQQQSSSSQRVTTLSPPIGVPTTTLLPSTTTLAPVETSTPELVEFRTIPPSELFVMCLADGIQVEVQLGGFDGIIYVKGHSQDPKCRKLVMSNGANEFVDFKVQFGHCDLIHRDGEAGFVLVIQKHPKLVTYRARAYHVKCVYNTGERTVTLGFNVSMITTSGTIANTGPPPTCLMSITALDGREVTSAEIGQDLLLRVDVQPDSIYGGFARSCEAKTMDDEGEYQYEVTDANGCATDPSIFSDWKYDQQKKSLVARFNAFKFPSSNNLRFQCNVRVCFGSCPVYNCNGIDAYGRKRRKRDTNRSSLVGSNSTHLEDQSSDAASSSAESFKDDEPEESLIVTDAFKEGALREEVMVQSNAILTFDRKEPSLPQKQHRVEDIEFVCLPSLGVMLSIGLVTTLALLALAIATSCWCFTKRKSQRANTGRGAADLGPLPHPIHFPNPLLSRSTSVSTLREPIYGA